MRCASEQCIRTAHQNWASELGIRTAHQNWASELGHSMSDHPMHETVPPQILIKSYTFGLCN